VDSGSRPGIAIRLAGAFSNLCVGLAGALLVGMTGYTLLESVLRSAFSTSTYVMTELVGYAMAPMTTLAMARTLRGGMLIRVNLLTQLLGQRARRFLELACVLVTLVVILYVGSLFWTEAVRNWQRGAVSDTIARVPLWIPPALILSGLPIFVLELCLYARDLLRGSPPIEEDQTGAAL
jgi:TRAP-type C4-dicarboxylate transport system permease small subunit